MAKRSGSSPLKQGAAALEGARKRLAQVEATRQANSKLSTREKVALDREKKRAQTAELRAEMAALRSAGLYEPKLKPGESILNLTRGRKQRIRSAFKQLESLARGSIFVRYPNAKPAEKKRIKRLVVAGGGTATKRGLFLKRDEGEMRQGTTTLVKERGTGLYKVVQVHRYEKDGYRRTMRVDRYLDGMEALEREEKGLKRRFDRAERELGKNERIRFTIGGPNGNVSRASFVGWSAFRAYLEQYRRDPSAMASFMASLTVYVATRERRGSREYRVPVAWVDKRGRKHEAAPENLFEGGVFPKPKRERKRRKDTRKRGTRKKAGTP